MNKKHVMPIIAAALLGQDSTFLYDLGIKTKNNNFSYSSKSLPKRKSKRKASLKSRSNRRKNKR